MQRGQLLALGALTLLEGVGAFGQGEVSTLAKMKEYDLPSPLGKRLDYQVDAALREALFGMRLRRGNGLNPRFVYPMAETSNTELHWHSPSQAIYRTQSR